MTGSSSLLPNAVDSEGSLHPQHWADHTMWWSERSRSRALLWPRGHAWFSNDPLGMRAHTHPDASEVFFVASGTMQLTVGRTPLIIGAGDYCLVPPDTYHDPLNVGDEDLCVWVVVAPNWRGRRWKASEFVESDFGRDAEVVPTATPGPLPSDELVKSEVIELPPNHRGQVTTLPRVERAVYVLDGSVHVQIERLSGRIGPHEFANVMAGAAHNLATGSSGARLLSVECRDPAAPDVEADH